jgi:uncharacterized protein YcnI
MKRLVLLTAAALLALLALAVPAFAHVTVSAPGATRGGSDQEITFRVPVEKKANTIGLTVALPTANPIASVDVAALPGWTTTTKTVKLAKPIKTDDGDITTAVSQITWRATAGGLKPGEYGEFTILAGQLPDAASITFRVLQRYSDGSTVPWNQVAAPGSSAEPENPAPVLTLSAGSGESTAPTATSSTSSSNTGPVVLSIVALVVAAGALGLAYVTRARSRNSVDQQARNVAVRRPSPVDHEREAGT